jgi:hypothetical protein
LLVVGSVAGQINNSASYRTLQICKSRDATKRLKRPLACWSNRQSTCTWPSFHAVTVTDPQAKLYRKGSGKEAKLSYIGNVMNESRHGLVVEAELGVAARWQPAVLKPVQGARFGPDGTKATP